MRNNIYAPTIPETNTKYIVLLQDNTKKIIYFMDDIETETPYENYRAFVCCDVDSDLYTYQYPNDSIKEVYLLKKNTVYHTPELRNKTIIVAMYKIKKGLSDIDED